MTAALRIGGFAAILAAVFAAAALAGSELDPSVDESENAHQKGSENVNAHASTTADESGDPGAHGTADANALPGLSVARGGLRMVPDQTSLGQGPSADYRFRIVDSKDEPVRDYDVEHERKMHLILIRRDFAGFQHLHPRQLDDGTWTAAANLDDPGVYRVFADFSSSGASMTLAADLFVAGEFDPRPLPAPSRTASAGDGYQVALDSTKPRPGGQARVEFTVTHNGKVVEEVEPYLGADGHLVALREHDQAFLHTHPEGAAGGSGPIRFDVAYPTAGRYRLFLQFRHGGVVRTVAFTQEVGQQSIADDSAEHEEGREHGH